MPTRQDGSLLKNERPSPPKGAPDDHLARPADGVNLKTFLAMSGQMIGVSIVLAPSSCWGDGTTFALRRWQREPSTPSASGNFDELS